LRSMSECVPNLSDLSLGESTGAARARPRHVPAPYQRGGRGGVADANNNLIRRQPSDTVRIPTLGVIRPYLDNLSDVVNDLLVAEGDGGEMCYALVDGRNVIYRADGVLKLKQDVMDDARKCLPTDSRTRVIVVWAQWMWDTMGFGGTDRENARRRKELACLFDTLRDPGTSVYFALVQYPYPESVPGKVWLPNGKEVSQSWCKLPGMWRFNHLACELDDAILTALHCELTKHNRCTIAVSGDRRVIKTLKELTDLEGWVKEAYKKGFRVVTSIMEVELRGDGCASSSGPRV